MISREARSRIWDICRGWFCTRLPGPLQSARGFCLSRAPSPVRAGTDLSPWWACSRARSSPRVITSSRGIRNPSPIAPLEVRNHATAASPHDPLPRPVPLLRSPGPGAPDPGHPPASGRADLRRRRPEPRREPRRGRDHADRHPRIRPPDLGSRPGQGALAGRVPALLPPADDQRGPAAGDRAGHRGEAHRRPAQDARDPGGEAPGAREGARGAPREPYRRDLRGEVPAGSGRARGAAEGGPEVEAGREGPRGVGERRRPGRHPGPSGSGSGVPAGGRGREGDPRDRLGATRGGRAEPGAGAGRPGEPGPDRPVDPGAVRACALRPDPPRPGDEAARSERGRGERRRSGPGASPGRDGEPRSIGRLEPGAVRDATPGADPARPGHGG